MVLWVREGERVEGGLAVAEQQWTCGLAGEGDGEGGGDWLTLSSSRHVVLWVRGWRGLADAEQQ